jgi:hypothetical protein
MLPRALTIHQRFTSIMSPWEFLVRLVDRNRKHATSFQATYLNIGVDKMLAFLASHV